jgi:hypothetical protein
MSVASPIRFYQDSGGSSNLKAPIAPLPDAPPQRRILSDIMILAMSPLEALSTYWGLVKYECHGSDYWITPSSVYSKGLSLSDAEAVEMQLRQRIYQLRTDLHYLQLDDGQRVEAMPDLTGVRTVPYCTDLGMQIGRIIIGLASGILTAGAGFAVSLAFAAMNTIGSQKLASDRLAAYQRLNTMYFKALDSATALQNDATRKMLVRYGYIQDNLDAITAAKIPTSNKAWSWAVSLGFPHPAMVLLKDPFRGRSWIYWTTPYQTHVSDVDKVDLGKHSIVSLPSVLPGRFEQMPLSAYYGAGNQERLLFEAAHDLIFFRVLDLQSRMEDAILNAYPLGIQQNPGRRSVLPWPLYCNGNLSGAAGVGGGLLDLIPRINTIDGVDYLSQYPTKLNPNPSPINIRQSPQFAAVAEWISVWGRPIPTLTVEQQLAGMGLT